MKVQAFITSGILEKYVLGLVTEEEREEVLEMASQHLEIKGELATIRNTFQSYLQSHQVALPEDMREQILSKKSASPPSVRKVSATSPAVPGYRSTPRKKEESGFIWAWLLAALLGIALLAVSYNAYSFMSDVEKAKEETTVASEEISNLEKRLAAEQQKATDLQSQLNFYHNRDNEIVLLSGSRRSQGSKATIYWNRSAQNASIDLPALPALGNGKVAVLWVNTDSRSQKVGVLKANPEGERTALTYIDEPSLFYVTEEDSPDAERPNRARILMTGGFQ